MCICEFGWFGNVCDKDRTEIIDRGPKPDCADESSCFNVSPIGIREQEKPQTANNPIAIFAVFLAIFVIVTIFVSFKKYLSKSKGVKAPLLQKANSRDDYTLNNSCDVERD